MSMFFNVTHSIINFKNDNSLKKQITLKFLAVGLIPLFVFSIIALWLSSNMAGNMVTQNLNVLKTNKAIAIEEYGKTIVNQMLTLAGDPNTAANLVTISQSFDKVLDDALSKNVTPSYSRTQYIESLRNDLASYYNNEFLPKYEESNDGQTVDTRDLLDRLSDRAVILQHAYIKQNPAPLGSKQEQFQSYLNAQYDIDHEQLHHTFEPFLASFGYYDIFLVDNQGYVVYSVFKELDYATNLLTGAYRDSGLAQAFTAVSNVAADGEYRLIDYAQYTPSYEAPASFIGSPVFKDGRQVGVLIFQMPLDAITAVMTEREGLGKTSEIYLVGQDNLMRSDSYKDADRFSVEGSFRLNQKAQSDAIALALKGESGIIESENYLGQEVLSGYTPVKFGDLSWGMIAEIETSEAFAPVTRLVWIIIAICAVAFASIIFFALRVANKLIDPIKSMQNTMAKIAENTDFSERVVVERDDEIGETTESLNKLLARLETSIKETNTVVTAMSKGDFSTLVVSDFQGDLLTLKTGVNSSAKAMGESIAEVNRVVDALARGDFNQQIDIPLEGQLATLKASVNSSILSTKSAMRDINKLISAMSVGDFRYKVDADLKGDFAAMVKQANTAMSVVNDALTNIDTVMEAVANGQLDSRIEAKLPGQLEQIKENINASISEVANVFTHTKDTLVAISTGKLTAKIQRDFPGQFDQLKVSTNETLDKLTEVVEEIKNTANTVNANSMEILNGNNQLSERTMQQSNDLDSTAVSMDEITSTVRHTAENAAHANKLANNAKESAINGGQVVKMAVAAMTEINEASSKIADIITVIDAIAFQTNLLALNAAVEAARAGEQGRGFAVVAGEVRNLAGRSANAAQEIKALINDTVEKVHAGSQLVVQSGETLNEIISQVENVNNLVADISNAANEQSIGIQSVHSSVESLKLLTQQNSGMVEEGTAASENLRNKASAMNRLMEFFETAS